MGISRFRTWYILLVVVPFSVACLPLRTLADEIDKRATIVVQRESSLQALTAGNVRILGFRDGGRGGPHKWSWLNVDTNYRKHDLNATIDGGTFGIALSKRKQSLVYFQSADAFRLLDADGQVVKEFRWELGFVTSVKSNGQENLVVVNSIDRNKRRESNGQLSVIDLDKLHVIGPIEGTQPTITQDGKTLFFIRTDSANGSRKSLLYQADSLLATSRIVKEFAPPFVQPTVSGDGRLIAGVSMSGEEFGQTLVLYDVRTGVTRKLSPDDVRCTEPLFSPTKDHLIAYRMRRKGSDGIQDAGQIILHSINGPLLVVEEHARPLSESYCWSHDGRQFYWIIDKPGSVNGSLLKKYEVTPP